MVQNGSAGCKLVANLDDGELLVLANNLTVVTTLGQPAGS